jgi:hypothetical protein
MGGSSKDGAMGGGVLRDDGALLDIVLRDTADKNDPSDPLDALGLSNRGKLVSRV